MAGLTRRQKTILYLMREHGIGYFRSGSRWWSYVPVRQGNKTMIQMQVFQMPEYHMEARGLIRRWDPDDTKFPMVSRTGMFELTDAGRKAAASLTAECLREPVRRYR